WGRRSASPPAASTPGGRWGPSSSPASSTSSTARARPARRSPLAGDPCLYVIGCFLDVTLSLRPAGWGLSRPGDARSGGGIPSARLTSAARAVLARLLPTPRGGTAPTPRPGNHCPCRSPLAGDP